MATPFISLTPFTPGRAALGDISNSKLFKSGLKTPLANVTEEIEKVYGAALLPEVENIEIEELNLGRSPLFSPKCYNIESSTIKPESPVFSDPGFEVVDKEIENYLEQGVSYYEVYNSYQNL